VAVDQGITVLMTVFQGAAVATATVAAGWDLTTRRIPNALTFGAAFAALAANSYVHGWTGLAYSVAGWVVGVGLFLPFFALGGMGAGDVKLLGALGAWLGPVTAVWVALFTGIAGGIAALAVGTVSGYLNQAFTNLWCLLMDWRTSGPRPVSDMTLSTSRGPRLAYAVPVLAGLVFALWWQR
jgi:prepilin peptidase CpaA